MRYLRDSREMWENYLTCSARLAKPADAVYAFHRLLDIRGTQKGGEGAGQQQWAPDVGVLEALVRQVCVFNGGGGGGGWKAEGSGWLTSIFFFMSSYNFIFYVPHLPRRWWP